MSPIVRMKSKIFRKVYRPSTKSRSFWVWMTNANENLSSLLSIILKSVTTILIIWILFGILRPTVSDSLVVQFAVGSDIEDDKEYLTHSFYETLKATRDSAFAGTMFTELKSDIVDNRLPNQFQTMLGSEYISFDIEKESFELELEVLSGTMTLNKIINFIQTNLGIESKVLSGQLTKIGGETVFSCRYGAKRFKTILTNYNDREVLAAFSKSAKWYLAQERPIVFAAYSIKSGDLDNAEHALNSLLATRQSTNTVAGCHYLLGISNLRKNRLQKAEAYFRSSAKISSVYDTDLQIGLGLINHRKLNFKQAQRHFLNALSSRRADLPTTLNLGASYFSNSQFKAADSIYCSILATDSMETNAIYGHGMCMLVNKDLKKAVEEFRRLVELRPNHYQGWLQIAKAHSMSGRRSLESAVLEDMVARNQHDSQSILSASGYFRDTNRPSAEISFIERKLKTFGFNEQILYKLIFAYGRTRNGPKAKILADSLQAIISAKLKDNGNLFNLWFISAELDFLFSNYDDAVTKYQRILQRLEFGMIPSVRILECNARLQNIAGYNRSVFNAFERAINSQDITMLCEKMCELGDTSQALKLFNKHVSRNPTNAVAISQLGSFLRVIKKYEQARAKLLLAQSIDSTNFVFYSNNARLFLDEHEPQEAENEYRRACQIEPSAIESRFAMVQILLGNLQYDKSRAFDLLDSISKQYSNNGWILNEVGKTYMAAKNFEKAVKFLSQATRYDSGLVTAWTSLGLCYNYLHKYKEASRAFREAFYKEPDEKILTAIETSLLNAEMYDDAIESYTIHSKLAPSNFTTINNWAYCLGKTGRYDEGLDIATQGLQLNLNKSSQSILNSTIAEIYGYKGDLSNFLKYLKKAMALGWKPDSQVLSTEPYLRYKENVHFQKVIHGE